METNRLERGAMIDQGARVALLRQFEAILLGHKEDRASAGLAVLRTMREAGVMCWTDVFPALAAWRGHRGWRDPVTPGATWPERVVIGMAPRLDDVPPADLAELAVLAGSPQTVGGRDRATAIAMPWNERRNAETKARLAADLAHAEKLAAIVREVK